MSISVLAAVSLFCRETESRLAFKHYRGGYKIAFKIGLAILLRLDPYGVSPQNHGCTESFYCGHNLDFSHPCVICEIFFSL